MAKFEQCKYCGANLDFGETCDCQKKEGAPPEVVHPKENNLCSILPLKGADVKTNRGSLYGT